MDNILFDKSCVSDLQKAIDKGNYEILDFDSKFLNISIGGIAIKRQGDNYILILPDGVTKDFMTKWRSTVCNHFIKDMKAKKFNLYKIIKVDNLYYILRLVNEETKDFHNIDILDNKYSLVSIGINGITSTYMKSYNLKDTFATIVESYETETSYEENSDELISKMLFEESELSN